ncbi:MAG: hypothetical protein DRH24_08540 [Deltaproteobacteria bacterium]|nr:MAG: hypothetical protein DRH24_08540 [Deltaproteobacteria bacterium]
MTLKDSALNLAKLGYLVFPCKHKKPLTQHGFKDATSETAQIETWWDNNPEAEIGAPAGKKAGFFVLDVDLPEGPATLKRLEEEHGSLPVTATQCTGGGGSHFFFKHPGGTIKDSVRKLGPGLDIRGDGGYIIMPPSPHKSGKCYQWTSSEPMADAPDWLLDLVAGDSEKEKHTKVTSTPYGQKALADESKEVSMASEGTRNHRLNQAAFSLGQLVAGGELGENQAAYSLLGAALESGLSKKESTRTIDSGMKAGMGQPRNAAMEMFKDIASIGQDNDTANLNGNNWPVPHPLPDELLPVKPCKYDLLPSTLRPWAKDICERIQCPFDFVAVAIMSCLATVIGRKIGIRPQGKTDWTEIPNMWAMIVGRPGVMKSPAIEAAIAPLKQLMAKANTFHETAYNEYLIQKRLTKLQSEAGEKKARETLRKNQDADVSALLQIEEPEEPTLQRFVVNDTTFQALGELLRQNPNGLLAHRDELVSLLKSLDREDHVEARGFYLTAWNGNSAYTFDRIGRGMNLHIPAVCLSMLGGTQPGRLSEYVRHAVKGGAADDGLIQRFGLLVWPDINGTWNNVDRWPDNDAKKKAYDIFHYLNKLKPEDVHAQQDNDHDDKPEGVPFLRFNDSAQELFLEWRTILERRLRSEDLLPAIESHFSKYRTLVPSLALIIHLAEDGVGPVSESATATALAWAEYLESHAQRVYGSLTHSEIMVAKVIIKRIRKGDITDGFSCRDIYRKGWTMLTDHHQVESALKLLVDYEWLQAIDQETGGRSTTEYSINPNGLS